MSKYSEERAIVHAAPAGSRAVVESQYDSVISERRGISGVAVGALVVAAVAAAVVITMLILNNQQNNRDQVLEQERARVAAAQQVPAPQQPVIVNVPQAQPAIVPAPYPVPGPAQPPATEARTAPSTASVEIEVTSRLQNDAELRRFAVGVKVTGVTVVLSGYVADEDLKTRAEKIAGAVTGVQNVINDIVVRP